MDDNYRHSSGNEARNSQENDNKVSSDGRRRNRSRSRDDERKHRRQHLDSGARHSAEGSSRSSRSLHEHPGSEGSSSRHEHGRSHRGEYAKEAGRGVSHRYGDDAFVNSSHRGRDRPRDALADFRDEVERGHGSTRGRDEIGRSGRYNVADTKDNKMYDEFPSRESRSHARDGSPAGRSLIASEHQTNGEPKKKFDDAVGHSAGRSHRGRSSSRNSTSSRASSSSSESGHADRRSKLHRKRSHRRSRSRSPVRDRHRDSKRSSKRERRGSRERSESRERRKRRKDKKRKHREDDGDHDQRRSVLTGKKIKLKVKKDKGDYERDANREQLLSFLNSAFE